MTAQLGLLWLVGLLFFLPFISAAFEEPQDWLRRSGLVLQVVGFIVTAHGLAGRGRIFDAGFRRWLKAKWRLRPRYHSPILGAMSVAFEARFQVSARGYVIASKSASIEDRLTRVEENLQELHAEVGRNSSAHKSALQQIDQRLNKELKALETKLARHEERIRAVLAADVHIEQVGLWAFVIGVTIATVPDEIVEAVYLLKVLG